MPHLVLRRQSTWLLGWYKDNLKIAGWKCTSCLQQIGGFTINDTKFLVEQTWLARASFLSVATVATVAQISFCGWGSFLHVVWRILGNNYRLGSSHMGGASGPHTPDQRQCWIHFIDIGSHYTLCSTEAKDTLMPAFLENGPDYSKPWKVTGIRSTLGTQDSNHIVQAFLTKLQDCPKTHILFLSMLLSYTCKNLRCPDTHKTISCIFLAILNCSWAEIIWVQELNAEQFCDLLNHIANLLWTMTGLLTTNQGQTQNIAEAILDDIFIEFLGHFTFSPLLVAEGALCKLVGTAGQSHLVQQLISFGASLKTFSLHHNLSPNYFLVWYKITQHLDFCLLLLNMLQFLKQRHIHPWHKCWSTFGLPLALKEQFYPTTQCGYPQCPVPNLVLLWECSSCKSKWYCGQRCQKAYVSNSG